MCVCKCVVVYSLSHVRLYGLKHSRLPCPFPSPRVCSNSRPLSWWCHPTISSSVIPFSSRLQCFPASGSFLLSLLFASGDQSFGASASASVLANIQYWFPLGWTSLISLLPKGLSRVFSNTAVQKHQFFGAHPSLWPNPRICSILIIKYLFLLLKELSHLPAVSEVNARAGPQQHPDPSTGVPQVLTGVLLRQWGAVDMERGEIQLLFWEDGRKRRTLTI